MDALDPEPAGTVVEVGPGRGALTDVLRERAGRIVAIEYDKALAARLRERYAGDDRLTILEADVLAVDLGAVAGTSYSLVGNVPYYITTPILFHAMRPPRPDRSVFLVQREVADRMTAPPGRKEYGALSVNLRALASVETVFRVAPGSFTPPPKVESAVVRVLPLQQPLVEPDEESGFRAFVQAAFGMRRKQLRRVVRGTRSLPVPVAEEALRTADIDPEARPETLSPQQFVRLFRALEGNVSRDS